MGRPSRPGPPPPGAGGPRPPTGRNPQQIGHPPPAPARRPPPPKPAPPPKPFEIRRGRRSSDDAEEVDEEAPLGQVVLPRSITQEAEEDSLKRRFNTDFVPDVTGKAPILQVAQSAGEGGPVRMGRQRRLALLFLLIVAAAAAAAWWYSRAPQ